MKEMSDEERAEAFCLEAGKLIKDRTDGLPITFANIKAVAEVNAKWGYSAGLQEGRRLEREECAKVAQAYADRNAAGESSEAMGWVSTYHRIAGENIRDEIRSRGGERGE